MNRLHLVVAAPAAVLLAFPASAGDWVTYTDETESRLVADPAIGVDDPDEKDFAAGDVDGDGDTDLVVVRKQGWSSPGRRRNVLLLNEGGVLVDRTAELASASDVDGDEGFLTPTNDRDVILIDLDGDDFPDIVTATTLSDGQPKHIGHPRIYMNQGVDGAGVWRGFRHEDARFPQLYDDDKQPVNPRFNAVAAGDVTGDGFPDLYFGDTDIPADPPGQDTDDRLLVNDGNGFFTDQSSNLMTPEMLLSHMCTAVEIVDMNGDGRLDVVKTTGLSTPIHVTIAYNSIAIPGVFDVLESIYSQAPIFISVGDLNNDEKPDVVVTDDGVDRYLLNAGNGPDGLANFTAYAFPSDSNGFGGNSIVADLDEDGVSDVVITDVDVEIAGCSREIAFFRNDGVTPTPTFTADVPVGFEDVDRNGTHDVAAFDLDGDGFRDLVLGRCNGLRIWVSEPPALLGFDFLPERPVQLDPDEAVTFDVQVTGVGGAVPAPGTGVLHLATNGGPFVAMPMEALGGDLYRGTFPAAACGDRFDYYVSAETVTGGLFTDPPDAPPGAYMAYVSGGVEVVFADAIEGDVSGWSVVNDASLVTGAWEQADPNGTLSGGVPAAPEDDATDGPGNVQAFVTQNGDAGGVAGDADIDGGPTWLVSPVFDLEGRDAFVSYARWFFTNDVGGAGEDAFVVEVSNDDGATWTAVASETTTGTGSAWETSSFVVGDHVLPTAQVRVRFGASDAPNDSITEAGVDDVAVEAFACGASCPADLDETGAVTFTDLLQLLAAWGPCADCAEDLDGDGEVGFLDLLFLLAGWGSCGGG